MATTPRNSRMVSEDYSFADIEQKLGEELQKDPEDTPLLEDDDDNPSYHILEYLGEFRIVEATNQQALEAYRWHQNKGDAETLLEEDSPQIERGRVFSYDPEDDEFIPYSK